MKQYIRLNGEEAPEWGGEFNWEDLASSKAHLKSDVRFTLYDTSTAETECLFFDVDGVEDADRATVVEVVCSTVGKYAHYAVDSGGGVHVYYPLETHLKKSDYAPRRSGYNDICETIAGNLLDKNIVVKEVDRGVFCNKQLGRAPNSYNLKRGKVTRFLSCDADSPVLVLEDKLPARAVPLVAVAKAHAQVMTDKVLRECRSLQHFKKNPESYSDYELWFSVGNTMKGIGLLETFLKWSKDSPHHDKPEDHLKNERGAYSYGCQKIRHLYTESKGDNPCTECPHYSKGGSPLFISGKLPTPSRKQGFVIRHTVTAAGAIVPIDPKLAVDATVNHYLNLQEETLCRPIETGEFWGYNGSKWIILSNASMTKGDLSFRKKMHELPEEYAANYRERQNMDKCLKEHTGARFRSESEFDVRNTIAFSDRVYHIDTSARKLTQTGPSPKFLNRSAIDLPYPIAAKCPTFLQYLDYVTCGDESTKNVLRAIMGLSISSIHPNEYQKFFWLIGNSGSGKSIFTTILQKLAGAAQAAVYKPFSTGGPHEMPDLRGKTLLVANDLKPHTWYAQTKMRFLTFLQELTGDYGLSQKVAHLPQMTINHKCTTVITSNFSLDGVGSVPGIERRYFPVEFFVEDASVLNPEFCGELFREMPGMYREAVKGLQLYLDGVLDNFSNRELKEDAMEDDSSPVLPFLRETYAAGGAGDKLTHKELYMDYMEYCEAPPGDSGHQRGTVRYLKKCVAEHLKVRMSTLSGWKGHERAVRFLKRIV